MYFMSNFCKLVPQLSSYQDPPAQTGRMRMFTVNYLEIISEHSNLSKRIGVPTDYNLHLLRNKIKSNAVGLHSNIGGGQHGYISLVATLTVYSLL